MSAASGLVGVGLFAIVCLAFFALLAGTLVYLFVFGDPEKKRWKAFAATHGWDCDGPWRLAGGPPDARWTLSADYDDDRGTGTITWLQVGVAAAVPHLLVGRRVGDGGNARAFLDAETDAVWLAALDAMPHLFADDDVMFEVRPPYARLRAEGARHRPPFDEVWSFVRLGLTLTARASGAPVRDIGTTSGVTS